jgi:DNA replication protein DnaC
MNKLEQEAKQRCENWNCTELYNILFEYFTGKEEFEKRDKNYSLNKGLLVIGGVGSGKTTAFEVFQALSKGGGKYFQMVSSRHIIRDFRIDQDRVIDKYGRKSFKLKGGITGEALDREQPLTLYIDDLGLEETNAKTYGNETNVIADILLDRYENFKNYNQKTYASSNLMPDELEKLYGARMRDRFKEMMNLIIVKEKSFR